MSKKLAIKGHPTRGKEVIELLEMLGGKNKFDYDGKSIMYSYYVSGYAILNDRLSIIEDDDFVIFNLEEFLEKYPFKVGDKVFDTADDDPGTIAEMKWDKDVSDMKYRIAFDNGDMGWFTIDTFGFLKKDKNLELEKMSVKNHKMGPKSKLPSKYYEDRLKEIQSKREYDELRMPLEDDDKLATEATIMDKKILPPDGYLVGKITRTDNGMLVEYVEKKPKYPTTYEECYDEGNTELHFIYVDKDERDLYESFIQLIRCRNAYWKIAGEEMGLGKPWGPDWNDRNQPKFGIHTVQNNIRPITLHVLKNLILIFPTTEMRDAFYENFKDLIEQCKELL